MSEEYSVHALHCSVRGAYCTLRTHSENGVRQREARTPCIECVIPSGTAPMAQRHSRARTVEVTFPPQRLNALTVDSTSTGESRDRHRVSQNLLILTVVGALVGLPLMQYALHRLQKRSHGSVVQAIRRSIYWSRRTLLNGYFRYLILSSLPKLFDPERSTPNKRPITKPTKCKT